MSQIQIIIPSLDRPAQLDCLLRSLLRYWDYNDLNIQVLYKQSNKEFAEGYYKVFQKHWYVHPYIEYNFGRQIKEILEHSDSKVVGFFTDDCVVYQQPNIYPTQIRQLFNNDKIMSFSLRLGLNTVIQDYLTLKMQPKLRYQLDDNYIVWKWSHYSGYTNWGYCFSWDGHFYDRKWILDKIECRDFSCPRALEHQLNVSYPLRLFGVEKPYMVACENSSVFVNTINMVQPDGPAAGTKYAYSPEELNKEWLSGKQIDLKSFDGLDIISCHEEFPLIWERKE